MSYNSRQIKLIRGVLVNVIIIALIFQLLIFWIPKLGGCDTYVVLSNSMQPTLNYGDLVVIKLIPFERVQVGDIATFHSKKDDSRHFTHRIVGINKKEKKFVTKGDANPVNDPVEIGYFQMAGKMIQVVPFAGFIFALLKNWIFAAIMAVLVVIWISIEIELFIRKKKHGCVNE